MTHIDEQNILAVRHAATADLRRRAVDAATIAETCLRDVAVACSAIEGRHFAIMQRGEHSIVASHARLELVKAKVAELEDLLPEIPTAWRAAA